MTTPTREPTTWATRVASRDATEALYAGEGVKDLDALSQPGASSRYVYLGLSAVVIVAVGALVLIRSGFADPARDPRTPWDLAIIAMGVVVTLVMAAIMARDLPRIADRARGSGIDQRAAALELAALVVTIPTAVVLSILALAAWANAFQPFGIAEGNVPTILAGSAMVLACLPLAVFGARRARDIRLIEQRFPHLLRDLNESNSAGLTMAQAIRLAARGDYGRLNPEVRRMADQISWGTSFPEALTMFADRVDTPLIRRAVSLIVKATHAGGNVKEVLAAAARDAREIKALEAERRGSMALYVIVIYVAFGVFLAVVAALQGLLMPSILASTRAASQAGPGLAAIGVDQGLTLQDFHFIYYGVGLVQAVGSGIVAGVMSEGTVEAGLKHTAILAGVTVLLLGVLL